MRADVTIVEIVARAHGLRSAAFQNNPYPASLLNLQTAQEISALNSKLQRELKRQ